MARNLIYSHTIADFRGIIASPGAILLEGHEIIDAGTPQEIGSISDVNIKYIEGLVIPEAEREPEREPDHSYNAHARVKIW